MTTAKSATTDAPAKSRDRGVVVHLSELTRAAGVLRNVSNLRSSLGAEAQVELVIHGDAIAVAFSSRPHADTLAALLATGLTVDVCRNSMTAQQIEPTELIPGVRIVASGVAHLARRQWDGLAYVRP